MALKCEAGLVYCRHTAEAICAVCRRPFCIQHGEVSGPYCRHCKRAFLDQQAVADAETAEVLRRELAAQHNAAGQCGWAGCDGALVALCQHCGLQYCSRHSNLYRYSYRYRTRRGVDLRHAQILLCDACKPALRLYKREKTWMEV